MAQKSTSPRISMMVILYNIYNILYILYYILQIFKFFIFYLCLELARLLQEADGAKLDFDANQALAKSLAERKRNARKRTNEDSQEVAAMLKVGAEDGTDSKDLADAFLKLIASQQEEHAKEDRAADDKDNSELRRIQAEAEESIKTRLEAGPGNLGSITDHNELRSRAEKMRQDELDEARKLDMDLAPIITRHERERALQEKAEARILEGVPIEDLHAQVEPDMIGKGGHMDEYLTNLAESDYARRQAQFLKELEDSVNADLLARRKKRMKAKEELLSKQEADMKAAIAAGLDPEKLYSLQKEQAQALAELVTRQDAEDMDDIAMIMASADPPRVDFVRLKIQKRHRKQDREANEKLAEQQKEELAKLVADAEASGAPLTHEQLAAVATEMQKQREELNDQLANDHQAELDRLMAEADAMKLDSSDLHSLGKSLAGRKRGKIGAKSEREVLEEQAQAIEALAESGATAKELVELVAKQAAERNEANKASDFDAESELQRLMAESEQGNLLGDDQDRASIAAKIAEKKRLRHKKDAERSEEIQNEAQALVDAGGSAEEVKALLSKLQAENIEEAAAADRDDEAEIQRLLAMSDRESRTIDNSLHELGNSIAARKRANRKKGGADAAATEAKAEQQLDALENNEKIGPQDVLAAMLKQQDDAKRYVAVR